jgi:MraZ protein
VDAAGLKDVKVDLKGRLFVPKAFIESDEDSSGARTSISSLWLTPGLEGCLWLIDVAEWKRMQRRLRSADIGNAGVRATQRMFFSRSEKLKVDTQGRVLLPEAHRQRAGITDRAVLLALVRRIEIWSPDRWQAYRATEEADYETNLDAILSGEMGRA